MGPFVRCLVVAVMLLTCFGCATMDSPKEPKTVHEWMEMTEQVHP